MSIPLIQAVQLVCASETVEHLERAFNNAAALLDHTTLRGDEVDGQGQFLLVLPSSAMAEISDNKKIQSFNDQFMSRLATLTKRLVMACENPLPTIEASMNETHTKWLASCITALCKLETEGAAHRNARGENILHIACREFDSGVDFLLKIDAWMQIYPDWLNSPRLGDAYTPLHVIWCNDTGAPYKIRGLAESGGPAAWMAYELHSKTVRETGCLLALGAKADQPNAAGVKPIDMMMTAYKGEFGEWKPNEAGLDWIEPVLREYEPTWIAERTQIAEGDPRRPRL